MARKETKKNGCSWFPFRFLLSFHPKKETQTNAGLISWAPIPLVCVCVLMVGLVSSSKFWLSFFFLVTLCYRQLKSRWKWTVMGVKEEFGVLFPTCQVHISLSIILLCPWEWEPKFQRASIQMFLVQRNDDDDYYK